MAKGDAATMNNAGAMNEQHAPLTSSLGGGSVGRQFGWGGANTPNGDMATNYAPASPIAPTINYGSIPNGSQMGGRFSTGMGLPNSGRIDPSSMVGPGSVSRMTGGGQMNSPLVPTDASELIRRIMMMSRF